MPKRPFLTLRLWFVHHFNIILKKFASHIISTVSAFFSNYFPNSWIFLSSLIFKCSANSRKLKIWQKFLKLSVKCSEFTSSHNQITWNRWKAFTLWLPPHAVRVTLIPASEIVPQTLPKTFRRTNRKWNDFIINCKLFKFQMFMFMWPIHKYISRKLPIYLL